MSRFAPVRVTIRETDGSVFAEHDLELPPTLPAFVEVTHGEDLRLRVRIFDLNVEDFQRPY